MKVKMQDIINFTNFYEIVRNEKLPVKTAYTLTKIAKIAEEELIFYREKFQTIIEDHALLDDSGNIVYTEEGKGVQINPEKESSCYQAIYELQNIDVELPVSPLSIEDFSSMQLTVSEIGPILAFFE